jgi:GAF domain-containing protein
MPPDRLSRILAELAAEGDGRWSSARLCDATRDIVGVSGAGVMIMSGDLPGGSLCTTNDVSNTIEELQYTLGEGPCVDAFHERRVVLEPDLAHSGRSRWLAFTPPAVEAGVGAVFAFPLQVGNARLGALDLYRDAPGPLSDDQHADALAMAEVITHWVLDVQADAPPGSVADELERHADFHLVVQNAAGAVSVQLGVSITEALIRLRAYAFSNDRLLRDVAEDVVARRLRF